jgi:hypothetical protein
MSVAQRFHFGVVHPLRAGGPSMLCFILLLQGKKLVLQPFHTFVRWLVSYQVSYQVGLLC